MVERKRHLAKAITYRIFGSATTAGIAYIATGHAGIGAAVGAADSVVKIVGYYVHERIWYRIRWGVGPEAPATKGEAQAPASGDKGTAPGGSAATGPSAAIEGMAKPAA